MPGRDFASVIFDLGGVLIDHPVEGILRYCADTLKMDPEALRLAHQRHAPDFQKGRISEKIYWERICSETGCEEPDGISLWGQAFGKCYFERPEIFSLASGLSRRGYKIGLISDTEVPSMTFFLGRRYPFFDFLVFSCLEGATKPAPEIFRVALERSGTAPYRTVFIDDSPSNVRGAEKVGMKGIVFDTPGRLKKSLTGLGIQIDEGSCGSAGGTFKAGMKGAIMGGEKTTRRQKDISRVLRERKKGLKNTAVYKRTGKVHSKQQS